MNLKMSTLLCCFISIITIEVMSGVHGRLLTHKQLVLTIKTQKGQVYDCVDFYKQPTLNHPFLQADEIHEVNLTSMQSQAWTLNDLGLKEGCPLGTVPILRSSNILKSPLLNSFRNGQHCTAVIRTKAYGDRKFHGAIGTVSIYKALIFGNQWSASRMKLTNGQESIEAGWMVNHAIFKDTEAHFYAKFTVGSRTCFNLECSPGFVQVSKVVPLGIIPQQYSHIGDGKQYGWIIKIAKNAQDGNWWLSFGPNNGEQIGYWPKSLFTSMAEVASQVEWGGEIDNPESEKTNPPYMGSGLTARDSTKHSACYMQIKASEGNFNYDDPTNTEKYEDCDDYITYDSGNQGQLFGRIIFYGGPYESIDNYSLKLRN